MRDKPIVLFGDDPYVPLPEPRNGGWWSVAVAVLWAVVVTAATIEVVRTWAGA